MKLFRTLFYATLFSAVAISTAYAQHPRQVLFEEFTAMTCPPCAVYKPNCDAFAKMPNVISVTYHQNYPAPGDPYNLLDNTLNRSRHDWYGVQGIPAAFISGKTASVASVASLQSVAAPFLAQQSPLLITITEDRSTSPIKVTVKVKNDGTKAISGVSLHTQVVNYFADLKDYSAVKSNQYTRYTDFDHCLLKALPNINGATFSIAAGEEKTVNYTYTMGTNTTLWNTPYVIAFIQNMTTKEVLQAGTDFESVSNKVNISSTEAQFMMTARAKTVKKTITLTNPSSSTLTVNVDFAATPAVPADWSAPTLSSNTVSVPAKGTATVDVSFNAGNNGGSVFATVKAVPTTAGLNIETSYTFGYVADNTKYCVLSGYSANGVADAYKTINGLTKYKNEVAYVPAAQAVFNALGNTPFSTIICPIDFANRGQFVNDELAGLVNELFNGGKRLLFFADAGIYNAMKVPSAPQGWNNFFMNLGLNTNSPDPTIHVNSSTGAPIAYVVNGVKGDVIGDNLALNLNTSTSMYNTFSEDVTFESSIPNIATFLNYGDDEGSSAGVRIQTDASRAIILGFNAEAIGNATARNAFYGKMMDWLTAEITVVKNPDLKITGTGISSSVDFGKVGIGTSKSVDVELKSSGTADLTITGIDIDTTYAAVFKWTMKEKFPLVIPAGEKRMLTLTFSPTTTYPDDLATYCTVISNAKSASDGEITFAVNGTAEVVASVEPGTSSDGSLSLSAAPNPVSDVSKISYTVAGNSTQFVTIQVVDALGNTVARLANGMMAPGTYSTVFNASSVAAGSYRLVMSSGAASTFVPVVVIK